MAMVHITNGNNIMHVSKSAFNELFRRQGWRIAGSEEVEKFNETTNNEDNIPVVDENKQEVPEGQDNIPENTNLEDEDELSEENEEGRDLEEIPLKEMSLDELKEFAALKEINIEGLDEKKQIRKAIREALNN